MSKENAEPSGTSESLTVDAAAGLFEGLMNDDAEITEASPAERKPRRSAKELEADEPEELELEAEEAPDPEDEGEGDDPEEGEEASEESPTYTVKVDGKEVKVTLEEALKGYSRTEDYTRKTQALAHERRTLEETGHVVRQQSAQYAAQLAQLETALKDLTPQEPDWAELRATDPVEFAASHAEWQQHKQRMADLAQERQRAELVVYQQALAAHQQNLAAEQEKLLDALPAWKDKKVARAEKAKLLKFAEEVGFTADEVNAVDDHRALVVLRKAMLYDAAQKRRPALRTTLTERADAARPGGAKPSRATSELTRSRQRLAKTGSIDDAAAVFGHLLDD